MAVLSEAQLARYVRDALGHLYDHVHLETHPLARPAMAAAGDRDEHQGRALQRLLLACIDALRPDGDPARDVTAWRRHQTLALHYVERLAPRDVQKRIGVGDTTFYRDHRAGLAAVASLLRGRWAASGIAPRGDGGDPSGHGAREPGRAAGNLPAARTSFVGRGQELDALAALVPGSRLVTLTGPGGCGKTRLAVEAARRLAGRFPDGVWLVDLAPVADPALVPRAVARALGMLEHAGEMTAATLCAGLAARKALLVLDTCEHLLDAAARLADDLVAGCADLRILATSRAPLRVAGEEVRPVPSLAAPPERDATAAAVLRHDAARLFVERTRSRDPRPALGDDDAAAIGRICRRLDGLPLAIEQAAARTAAFTPRQVDEHLDDRLGLLADGERGAPPRHRTMEATLDWSHDLLTGPERLLFRRLAVFRGGWTLEAAEEVCADAAIEGASIFPLVGRLVEQSLVAVEQRPGRARYRMLETVHAYALARLEAAGEGATLRARHLAWCRALAGQAWPELISPPEMARLDRLGGELDNVRAAPAWAQAEAFVTLATVALGRLGHGPSPDCPSAAEQPG